MIPIISDFWRKNPQRTEGGIFHGFRHLSIGAGRVSEVFQD
jgi:hypothetical protein